MKAKARVLTAAAARVRMADTTMNDSSRVCETHAVARSEASAFGRLLRCLGYSIAPQRSSRFVRLAVACERQSLDTNTLSGVPVRSVNACSVARVPSLPLSSHQPCAPPATTLGVRKRVPRRVHSRRAAAQPRACVADRVAQDAASGGDTNIFRSSWHCSRHALSSADRIASLASRVRDCYFDH